MKNEGMTKGALRKYKPTPFRHGNSITELASRIQP